MNYGGNMVVKKTSDSDIALFLSQMKRLLSAGKYDFVPRRKCLQSMAQCGLTLVDAKNVIAELEIGDYYKGPKQDFDTSRPGDIWEFKKSIYGKKFYMKIKIVQEGNNFILKCLAFHEDDFA